MERSPLTAWAFSRLSKVQAVNFVIALAAVAASVWVGHYFGYRRGFADCEWSHDFDRCPHCDEALGDKEDP